MCFWHVLAVRQHLKEMAQPWRDIITIFDLAFSAGSRCATEGLLILLKGLKGLQFCTMNTLKLGTHCQKGLGTYALPNTRFCGQRSMVQ